jgi:predicted AlkP superfamily pyrophosphatase or phosphodiesterase
VKRTRVAFTLALILLVFASIQAQQPVAPSGPRLILVLSIDQMRFDYLARFNELYKGGFRRLLDQAAIFSNAAYRHAATETGPGHSVILSGRHPSHSGIVGNEWWDSFLKRRINVVDDPVQASIGGEGRAASPANFVGFTVGDVLKRNSPESRVVGVSLKDRSAVLMAGKRPDGAYWFGTGGRFISSTYYARKAPQWLLDWNDRKLADKYSGQTWERLLPDVTIYDRLAGPDAVAGEADSRDNVFPHKFNGSAPENSFYNQLPSTPFGDELTLEFALEAMKAHNLGGDSITDLFAIGFSATDYIGHRYGPSSHEAMDQLLRLDLLLDRLLKHVDQTVGLANTIVVLTADHGAQPLVESLKDTPTARRVDVRASLLNPLQAALQKKYPNTPSLISDFTPDVYLDEEAIRKSGLKVRDVEAFAKQTLMTTEAVAAVYTRDDFADEASTNRYLPLFRNAFFDSRSPHLTLQFPQYVYPGLTGTGHGSPYDYDRAVPIIFMGSKIRKGTYGDACGPEDIAPTLAKMLGLEYPMESDSRLLLEVLP